MTICYKLGRCDPEGVSLINKSSFMAELKSLLAFLDREDRDRVLRH